MFGVSGAVRKGVQGVPRTSGTWPQTPLTGAPGSGPRRPGRAPGRVGRAPEP